MDYSWTFPGMTPIAVSLYAAAFRSISAPLLTQNMLNFLKKRSMSIVIRPDPPGAAEEIPENCRRFPSGECERNTRNDASRTDIPPQDGLCLPPGNDDRASVPGSSRREPPMIRVEDLVYRYDREAPEILRGIRLTIEEGTHTALIGPNGCGKTTLIKHLNALLFPTAGSVHVDGMITTDTAAVREIRRRVGMVFQNPDSQIVGMTVEEDVAFGPGNLALPAAEIRRRVDDCLAMVGLSGVERRPPHTLSGGEKRLLSIAGVLAMAPRYIAFDEPTAYLDPAGRRRVLEIIRRLHREGMAIIHIAHDMRDVAGAERVVVMDRGGILTEGTPGEVFSDSDCLRAIGLDCSAEGFS
jgi:biotin transport system ATP-binding protein